MHMTRVLVLYNEPVLPPDHPDAASEREVLDSVAAVTEALQEGGFTVARLGVGTDPGVLLGGLRRAAPDVVFNLFEGLASGPGTEATGEETVAGLLEWLGIPYTGSPETALTLARDKVRTKYLLRGAGLPTPAFFVADQLPCPPCPLPWPAIVKPACLDASVGIDQASVVTSQVQLEQRVAHILGRHGPPVLVEQFVCGREFHVHVLDEGDARLCLLPLAEIEFREQDSSYWPIYSYEAKWSPGSREYEATILQAPVALEPEPWERLGQIARQAYRLVGCRDYARIDVRMTAGGQFFILEVNPNPSFTSRGVINGFAALGRTRAQFFRDLARAALARRTTEGSQPCAT
jgi:D-alanine-D-alanine ligase